MRFLQKLPEEGPLSLMVDGKIILCKSISITEDLVMVTDSDDAIWYLDPDRIAGFSSEFLGEGIALEEEILPSMHPHESDDGAEVILTLPDYEEPSRLRETVLSLYPLRPLGIEEMEALISEAERLQALDDVLGRKTEGEALFTRIVSCEVRFPECDRGFLALKACLYALWGEARKSAALFWQSERALEALSVLTHQGGFLDEEEERLLIGFYLGLAKEGPAPEEGYFARRYAALCREDAQMGLFPFLARQRGKLGKAGEDAVLYYLERKHPEKRFDWEEEGQLLSYLGGSEGGFSLEEGKEAVASLLSEAPQSAALPLEEEQLPAMAFYVSTVKSRSYAGYQQAHLFFRKEAPQEGEERHYQEVYLNPRQVLDPFLGELLQKGSETDIASLRIAFTPILNDKGVAGGDAFLIREDRNRLYAQASEEVPRWCKHETFIRYGARPYMGSAQMEAAFTKAACDAHQVEDEGIVSDWQVFRFLRMALCDDVEGAALPNAYGKCLSVKRCALALMGASSKEEKNLWISRLFFRLRENGQEEDALLLEYFLFGLPSGNAFHMDKDAPGKVSKEALWVKMQTLCGGLRLVQIPAVAASWRSAMLKDRRVSDSSLLNGSHKRAWEKVSCLEACVNAFLQEKEVGQAVRTLEEYLSDTEKEKCRLFLALAESLGEKAQAAKA